MIQALCIPPSSYIHIKDNNTIRNTSWIVKVLLKALSKSAKFETMMDLLHTCLNSREHAPLTFSHFLTKRTQFHSSKLKPSEKRIHIVDQNSNII